MGPRVWGFELGVQGLGFRVGSFPLKKEDIKGLTLVYMMPLQRTGSNVHPCPWACMLVWRELALPANGAHFIIENIGCRSPLKSPKP